MKSHLVLISEREFKEITSGKLNCLIRFFKKRMDSINSISKGDLIYLRLKKSEIKGRFLISKLILIESPGPEDYETIKIFSQISKEDFRKKLELSSVAIIVQTNKVEQFITSPVVTPKSTKEWIILEN